MNNRLQLLVVIINYRSYDMTRCCIETLYPQITSTPGRRVVVVDNDSGDDSADRLDHAIAEHGWGDQIELVRSPVNGGFSAGNNVGIRHLDAEYYLLINSDTEVRKGAIDEMLAGMEQLPRAGLIGPRLEWPDAEPQGSCFQFRHPGHEFFKAAGTGILERLFRVSPATLPISDEPVQSQWVSFACVMIRRAVIEQVGLMDEGYFMYEEDVDYCRRAGEAGWEAWYWPAARVVHLRGGSSPVKSLTAQRKRRPRYYYASRARYFGKFYGRLGLWTANILWTAGRAVAWVREILNTKQPHACERQWLDIWTNAMRPLLPPSVPGGRPGGNPGVASR